MKNLTNILRRSNLSPKERILAVVQNENYKEKNGKGALSESEIHAISHGWTPKDSYEAKEYNRYLETFKLERSMRIDARMVAYRSENFLLRSHILVNYTMNLDRNIEDLKKNDSLNRYLPQEEIINFTIKNTYIDYDKLVHIMTFNNLPKEIKDDLLLLDEYASYDGRYLEDEVFLFEIFKNSKTLNDQDKNIIVDRVFSCIYREGFRKLKNGSEKDGFMIFHSFAELPMSKVFEKWAEYANIDISESNNTDAQYLVDKFEEYARDKNKSMKTIMKETISKWIDEGLFVSEYTPIFFSNRNDTWNGNTKLTHKEIFIKWYTELQKTESFMEKLISNGDIEVKFINKEILDTTEKIKVVTGESLYRSKINIDFVKEYKEQITILSPIIGLFLFVKKCNNPIGSYKTLKSFHELSKIFSDIFDIDLTDKYSESLQSFEQEMSNLNQNFCKLLEKATELLYTSDSIKYVIEIKEEKLYFDLNDNSIQTPSEDIDVYKNELKKLGFRTDI